MCFVTTITTTTTTTTTTTSTTTTTATPFYSSLDFVWDYPGEPARKVKQIWILLEQETVSGSGIAYANLHLAADR